MARVSPALGAVARLSGRLANNPWLEGGDVNESEGKTNEVVEHELRVDWREGLWMVSAGEIPPLGETAGSSLPESLGIVRLEQEVSDFPAGSYLLRRRAGGSGADSGRRGAGPLSRPDFGAEPLPVLLAAAGSSWPPAEPKPLPPAAFVLFDPQSVDGIQAGPFGRLPGAAILHPPGKERWRLPAGDRRAPLRAAAPRGIPPDGGLLPSTPGASTRARSLAPGISSLTPPQGDGPDGRLVLGLWMQPRPALRLVAQTRKILEKIPLVDRAQVQRWRVGRGREPAGALRGGVARRGPVAPVVPSAVPRLRLAGV